MPNPGLAYKLAELLNTVGPASAPSAAAPANDVSLYAALRDVWDVLRNGTGGAEPATNKSIMDYVGASPTYFNPLLGYTVTKVHDLATVGATDDLFTVTGRVFITQLTGEVTTVVGGAATLKLRDTTNSVDLCAATTIDTDAVGTMYALTNIAASILNGTGMTPVIGSVPNLTGSTNFMVRVVGDAQAALTIGGVLDAADTGAITWSLSYIPLISGATVVAAA